MDGIHLRGIVAASLYIPDVDVKNYLPSKEIHELKETGEHAALYAEVLEHVARQRIPGVAPSVLVPVPSTTTGEVEIGVKQLTEQLGARLGVKLDDVLRFRGAMHTQKGLNQAKREANMNGAMAPVNRKLTGMVFAVDDISTTGSTLKEAARVLCKAGADGVYGFVAGRNARLEWLATVGVLTRVEE